MREQEFDRTHLQLVNQKLISKVRELEEANRQRAKLLLELVTAGETQRARIAADIHDDSIQIMSAAALRLEMLGRELSEPSQRETLDAVADTVRQAVTRLRRLIFDLSPRALESAGLAGAIQEYLREIAADGGFDWHIEDETSGRLARAVETILYRVAQEAIRNAQKHSRASSVRVTLERRRGGTVLRVADDGVGLAAEATLEHRPGHVGIASMRQRVAMAGGRLNLDSAPGRGCTIEVWLPDAVSGVEVHPSRDGHR